MKKDLFETKKIEISELLRDMINGLFINEQEKLGIMTGDCEPLLAFELDNKIESLSETISKILMYQLG